MVRSQRSTRSAAKRQRQQSAVQSSRQAEQLPPGHQGVARITGKASATTLGIWAAKKTITKAVFCVDNVHLACKEDDIRAYVSSLGVEVFSCFKTKPRRRPNEATENVMDRSAFRVCVNAAGRDRLLNPESWPDSVRIADWFFPRQQQSSRERGEATTGQSGISDSEQLSTGENESRTNCCCCCCCRCHRCFRRRRRDGYYHCLR